MAIRHYYRTTPVGRRARERRGGGYGSRTVPEPVIVEQTGPRERALAGAERLVAVHGFERVRLRDVAKEAGVSIGALQHHFETRDGLLRETFLWSAGRRVREWAAVADRGGDPWTRLVALLERAVQEDEFKLRSTIWIEFCAAASRDEEIRSVMADLYDQWRAPLRRAIADGVEAGIFDPAAPIDDVVDILAAQIDGAEVAGIVAPTGVTVPHLRELVLAVARMALRVRDGVA
jgi:AcrR family transcriptional regulator